MPSITCDPGRIPTRAEAAQIADSTRRYAAQAPDGSSDDYLAAHLLEQYARGQLIPVDRAARLLRNRADDPGTTKAHCQAFADGIRCAANMLLEAAAKGGRDAR